MKTLDFRIEDQAPTSDGVAVSLLTSVLQGAQRAVYLFALLHEGRTIEQRARLSPDLEKKYQMTIGTTRPGSFVVSAVVGVHANDLFGERDVEKVVSDFTAFGRALAEGDLDSSRRLVSDSGMRTRVVEAFRTMLPRPGSDWRLAISNGAQATVTLDATHAKVLPRILGTTEDDSIHTVTGRLTKIAFDEHKLTIEYPPTRSELQCFYAESVEEMLIENCRSMIQVTGRVIYDRHQRPKKVVDVTEIRDLDLSPFHVHEIPAPSHEASSRSLRLRNPLFLSPTLDVSCHLMSLLSPELGIDVFAETRDELLAELHEQVWMLWDEYALEEDSRLAPDALRLKAALLREIEVRTLD